MSIWTIFIVELIVSGLTFMSPADLGFVPSPWFYRSLGLVIYLLYPRSIMGVWDRVNYLLLVIALGDGQPRGGTPGAMHATSHGCAHRLRSLFIKAINAT